MAERKTLSGRRGLYGPQDEASGPGLWAWQRAWPRRLFEKVNVVCVGSSTTHGMGASAPEYSWVGRLGYMLRGVDGSGVLLNTAAGGIHYRADHGGWTNTGTLADTAADLGGNSKDMTAGATMTRSCVCDGFEVILQQGAGIGQCSLQLDSDPAKVITITPSTLGSARADGEFSSWVTYPLARGVHTVKMTAIGRTVLNGVYATDGDQLTGLRVYNAGKSGSVSGDYTTTGALWAQNAARMGQLQPRLIVLMVGSNDYSTGVAPATYEANVRAAVRLMRLSNNAPVSVLLVHSYRRLDIASPTYAWSLYGEALQRIALDTVDVDFLDVSAHWPVSRAADWEGLFYDDVHCSDRGHALMAHLISEYLKRGATLRSAPPSQASAPSPDPATLSGLVSAWRASDLNALADAALVASWPAYAGSDQKTLAQADANRQPTFRKTPTDFARNPYVDFDGNASTLGDLMTCSFTSRVNPPATVVIVARLRGHWGSMFSGYQGAGGVYLTLSSSSEMQMVMGGGSLSTPYAATVQTGRSRWAVYVCRWDGANSAFFQSHYPKTALPGLDTSHANAGLPGVTLAGNSAGSGSWNRQDVSDLLVFNRALSDAECENVLAWYGRKYGFDGVGRSSV
ncbi:GDSL-type esterase/lipase family protein [Actinosynnema sp. NPDC059335]|uniref:GDSL-type esterase/lipase family protein n=1 Tax=Actinosynnema sp. NPDC059335 TaxID=3346804 RepID=UPI00366D504B